jgi:hypothetical protein
MVTYCPQCQVPSADLPWKQANLLLIFDPGTDVFRPVSKVTTYAPAFRTDPLVPPLIKSRHRDTAKVCGDILRSPEPILYRVENGY